MEAVTRLEAGEALEAVLADFPAEERDELRELLTIVAATHHLQESAIPHPSPERRATGKRAFLQAAAELKPSTANQTTHQAAAQQRESTATAGAMVHAAAVTVTAETGAQPRIAEQPVSTHVTNRQASTARAVAHPTVGPTWNERLRDMWAALLNSFTPVSVRLAPLALMLLLLWLTSVGVVSAAQDSLPGDIVYPAKKWIREQALTLAAPEDKPQVNEKNEEEVAEETEMARARGTAVLVENVFIFHGYKDDYLHIGPFYVEAQNLTMPADVMPGAGVQVRLRYQVAPAGKGRTEDGVPIVQGIALSVVENAEPIPATATPTAVPTMTASATNTPTNTPICSPWRPAGWVAYTVQPGDNLGEIANRVGSSTAELIAVNCISDANVIRSGARLWVPRAPVVITPAPVTTTNTPLVLTLTTVSTAQPTGVSLTPTASTLVTSTPTLLPPTVEATTVEVTPTVPVSGTVIATTTPRPETTTVITVTATVVVTGTPVAPESTPVVPTPAPEMTTTVEATPDTESEGTATAPTEAAPTVTVEETPSGTPTAAETVATGTATPDAPTPRPTTDSLRAGTEVPAATTQPPEATPESTVAATPDGGATEPDNGNPDDSSDGGSEDEDSEDEDSEDEDSEEVGGASGNESEPTDASTPDASTPDASTPDGTTGGNITATTIPVATAVNPTATIVPQTPAVLPSPTATAVAYPTATTADNTGTGGESSGTEPPTATPTAISRSPLGSG